MSAHFQMVTKTSPSLKQVLLRYITVRVCCVNFRVCNLIKTNLNTGVGEIKIWWDGLYPNLPSLKIEWSSVVGSGLKASADPSRRPAEPPSPKFIFSKTSSEDIYHKYFFYIESSHRLKTISGT